MNDETRQHLQQLNKRFIHNYVTNDVASHDEILHARFCYINSQGRRVGRADYLKGWATGFHPDLIEYWDLRDEHILLVGDVALVSAVNKFTERQKGDTITGMAAYTDTYVHENGRWLCLQAQITMVNPAYWPEDETIICSYHKGILQAPRSGGLS